MGAIAGLAAGGVGAFGDLSTAYAQSKAIRMQGNYEKNQLQFNSQVADLQAQDAIRRGEKEVKSKKLETKQKIGAQRAALAAQGLDPNQDTALLMQEDTAGIGAEDVATIKNNAWREAWGYQVESLEYKSQSKFADISSKFNSRQTMLTGGMKFVKDITNSAKNYAKVK